MHKGAIPRIGGLAIVAGILIPTAILIDLDGPYLGIFIGTLLVAALGLFDDLHNVTPSRKLVAVMVIALIPVAGFGVTFDRLTIPGVGDFDIGWVAYPLSVLWIALLANLVNLIDGMDSLAAGIVAIAAAAFAILSASFGRTDAAVLSAIVCGSTLAFLFHNYHPAKIFMGDSGALALGFLLATLSLDGVLKTAAAITLVAPLLVLAVPILDTSFVVLKRLKYGRAPWRADHNHFYHRFMRIGFSQRRTAAYLHVWAGTMAAYALLARFVPPRPRGDWDLQNSLLLTGVGLLVIGGSIWMVYSLEILKSRHLHAVGLRRFGQDEAADAIEGEPEEAVERALEANAPSRLLSAAAGSAAGSAAARRSASRAARQLSRSCALGAPRRGASAQAITYQAPRLQAGGDAQQRRGACASGRRAAPPPAPRRAGRRRRARGRARARSACGRRRRGGCRRCGSWSAARSSPGEAARACVSSAATRRFGPGASAASAGGQQRGGDHAATVGPGQRELQQVARIAPHAARRARPAAWARRRSRAASSSSFSRPSRTSCSSTPPSGPSNIDHTGVPSTAASRFIVPPAETSTSASATRLRPSTVRSGTTTRSSPSACTPARCSSVRASTTVCTRGSAAARRSTRASSGVSEPPR